MGTRVEQLVERAAVLARDGDLPAALAALSTAPTADLDAAFSLARRRRSNDPGLAAAADLLEAAGVARRRGHLAPPRWWGPPWLAFGLIQVPLLGVNAWRWRGWVGLAVAGAVVVVLVALAVMAARRLDHWTVTEVDADGTGRASELTSAAVRALRDTGVGGGEGTAALADAVRSYGPAAPVLALAALRRAEVICGSWPRDERRPARERVARVRDAVIADDLDGIGPRQLRRLARRGHHPSPG